MMTPEFKLQFDPARIQELAEKYNYLEDRDALEAGGKLAARENVFENLEIVFSWKTKNRGISRIRKNSPADVIDAVTVAATCKRDRTAISVLLGLSGVDIPVASAILAMMDPERFTVIDFRALEALGAKRSYLSVQFYLDYLEFCRNLSRNHDVNLRTLDRALWQWSKDGSDERNSGANHA